jgi:hypothetical protein
LNSNADELCRSSQLRSSVVTDRAGAQPLLERILILARDHQGRLLQRLLNLGDGRDRHGGRQHRVEHMVVAQISVGEDIIADLLADAQAAAMADHQPRLGRSTPRWSVIVFALAGPTPILTRVMPVPLRPSGDRPASGTA